MKQIILSLLLLSSLSIAAHEMVVNRQKKQQTIVAQPKEGGSKKDATKKQSVSAAKSKRKSKRTAPAGEVRASYSNGTLCVNGINYSMVCVKGGTFNMGATSEQGNEADYDEKIVHQVTLSDFYIGKYEVPQELWQAVTGSNPSKFRGGKKPVESISWDDCQAFISKLNSLTGKCFRLPTEAEWEFASRGGTRSRGYKYSGSNTLDNVAWYADNSGSTTHDVGTKVANELGIYDMSGNVWEWCQDGYDSYSNNSQTNPKGAYGGSHRVNRGGSWFNAARECRVSFRDYDTPTYHNGLIGLRLVLKP